MASQVGIEKSRVYEVNKSVDTNAANAYVTGIGATKRIVIWDTAIQQQSEDQLLFLVGHEIGHYVLNHPWWIVLFFTLIFIVTLFLISLVGEWCLGTFKHRFGFEAMSTIASLPLLFFLYGIFSILLAPIGNLFSQKIEHDAEPLV
ncbi:MAG: M48 family metalloprotease [Simkaniaceae bacterium]|nr:M48 family metalloprotease [Simkaniaceae bacterium]